MYIYIFILIYTYIYTYVYIYICIHILPIRRAVRQKFSRVCSMVTVHSDFLIALNFESFLKQLYTPTCSAHCNSQQLIAIHCNNCNTLQHSPTSSAYCNLLHHTVPHCTTLHHVATYSSTVQRRRVYQRCDENMGRVHRSVWGILQHMATHCNTKQYTATHCNTLQHTATHSDDSSKFVPLQVPHEQESLQHTEIHCDLLLQHIAPHGTTRRHTAPLQHTATYCTTL